jgi:hypothetical protein
MSLGTFEFINLGEFETDASTFSNAQSVNQLSSQPARQSQYVLIGGNIYHCADPDQ